MRARTWVISAIVLCNFSYAQTYVGSTPAAHEVRQFLNISLKDSIDFIRWKLKITIGRFDLECRYGLSKPGTPGFEDEKQVAFRGTLSKEENRYSLVTQGRKVTLIQINHDLLHSADQRNVMLAGNGGYSYALNNTVPVKSDDFSVPAGMPTGKAQQVFEGRTPCQELSAQLRLNKSEACNKMKWYVILYNDSISGRPSYYLKGGVAYREETMERGKWDIIRGKNNRIIFRLTPNNNAYTIHLLKGDDNILFFTTPDGRLLVGNEDFSYTLNRRKEEYPRR